MMNQQIATFEVLFPSVDKNGVYLCEDMHTSYWKDWGGGYKKRGTFVEYSKDFIDYINAWHSHAPLQLRVSDFTKSVHSLHYYDSVLVIEKRPMEKPCNLHSGKSQLPPDESSPQNRRQRLKRWVRSKIRNMRALFRSGN